MNKLCVLLPCLALLAGCGGGGGSSSSSTPSVFQGGYGGTYDASFLGDSGTLSPTVSRSGSVSGTAHSDALDLNGTISGHFSDNGSFTGTIKFPGRSTATLEGVLTKGSDGSVSGTITETYAGDSGDVTIDLSPR